MVPEDQPGLHYHIGLQSVSLRLVQETLKKVPVSVASEPTNCLRDGGFASSFLTTPSFCKFLIVSSSPCLNFSQTITSRPLEHLCPHCPSQARFVFKLLPWLCAALIKLSNLGSDFSKSLTDLGEIIASITLSTPLIKAAVQRSFFSSLKYAINA